MKQVLDGLEAHPHPEFLFADPLDVAPPVRTDAILGPRWVLEPLLQPGVVLRGQPPWPSGTGPLLERLGAPGVVLGDPILDGTERAPQALGDVGRRPPLLGQDDGLES